jgi:hypothetical protein
LGHAFHSRRLRLVSSQVGHVPALRLPRWTYARRMSKALELLCDPRLDVLISAARQHLPIFQSAYATILAAP